MKTSVKRLLSLLCVVAIGTATMASCKKDTDVQTSSEEYEIEYVYEYEETESTESEGTETDSDAESVSSEDSASKSTSSKGTSSKSTSSKSTSSKSTSSKSTSSKSTSSKSTPSKSDTTGSTASVTSSETTASKTTPSKVTGTGSYHKWDYSSLKGKKVTFAMWTDFIKPYAESVIKTFEKETGMDFAYMNVPQRDYVKTVAGKIAQGSGPDVVISNSEFPGTLQILQPVNDYADLSDPIWDKSYTDIYTINGKSYLLCAASSLFGGGGGSYVIWYNKTLFKKAGVEDPGTVYTRESAKNNWNWNTLEGIMKSYANSADKPKGTGTMFTDHTYFLQSIGTDFFKYDPSTLTFSSNVDDPLLENALNKMAEWKKNGYGSSDNILSGKAAMQISFVITKKDIAGSSVTINDLGFVPAPDYDANNPRIKFTGGKGWGIAKGAQNPEGAAIFIKYYSDPNNYDQNEFFVSNEFIDLFYQLKTEDRKEYFSPLYGVLAANGMEGSTYWRVAASVEAGQASTRLSEYKYQTKAQAAKATEVLQKYTK